MKTALALLVLLCTASVAQAEKLIVSFSSDHIAIDSNFAGAELTAFGTVEREPESPVRSGPYAIVMTVRGPPGTVTVREKMPVGPFWLNRRQQIFHLVPSYLSVLASQPVDEIIDENIKAPLAASVYTQIEAYRAKTTPQAGPNFAVALIRIRSAQGLFNEDYGAVTFLSPALFRAAIRLPGAAPLGQYQVDVTAFADGEIIAATQKSFWVNCSGLEHVLAVAARRHGVLYGLAVIAMALAFGWIASVIFRRD